MSYDENRTWINRQLFYHEDKIYNTGGSLSVDITTSTADGKTFNPPKLYLRLRNLDGRNRNFSLDFAGVDDLLQSLVKANFKNPDLVCQQGENNAITKRGYNIQLHVVASVGDDGNQIVVLSLIINESDQGKIAIPFPKFTILCKVLNVFQNNFWTIYTDLQRDYQNNLHTELLNGIKTSIQKLPSYLSNPTVNNQVTVEPDTSEQETSKDSMEMLKDFSQFEQEVSPTIPEVEHMSMEFETGVSDKPVVQEIKSVFFEKILDNKVENFINLIETIYHDPKWPTEAFISNISVRMNLSFDELLPGLSDIEHKSLAYLSKVNFWTALRGYIQQQLVIPSAVGILRYNPSTPPSVNNIELAYDLLTLIAYVHRVRETRESRDADANKNLSIVYTAIRCFLDPFVFSFLVKCKPDVVKNCVMTRYQYYKDKGFFNLPEDIHISDIEKFLDKIGPVLSQVPDVKEGHDFGFEKGTLLIPYENKHTIEQIINTIVDKTVKMRLGEEVSENPTHKKVDHKKKTVKYNSNIHRVLSEVDYIKQIPESVKEKFLEYVSTLDGNFDYTTIQMEELGDDVVKALYVWNESDNKKEAYSTFRSNLEQCIMTKDLILLKIKGAVNEDQVGGEDNFDFGDMNLVL